jgi:phage gpG-like protein
MSTPGVFASFLVGVVAGLRHDRACILDAAAEIIERDAKAIIGTHDAGWPPLLTETIAKKKTGDSPLLETGELRESIQHTVVGDHAYVGSNSDKAVHNFLGTVHIPARDPLVPAAMRCEAEVTAKVGKIVFSGLTKG